jgi:hypothetical protein
VLTWPDGRPLHPDLITDWFQRHAERVAWDQAGRAKVGLPPMSRTRTGQDVVLGLLAGFIPLLFEHVFV